MTAQVEKADQRMYHVRRLRNSKIIYVFFYNSTVSSVLVYAVPCMFNLCDKEQKNRSMEICQENEENDR